MGARSGRGVETVTDPGDGWRAAEMAIIGGCAHALNGSLTGLLLAAELGRMDDRLPAETLDVIEQQSVRIGTEIAVLFTLRTLDSPLVELHDPLELARTAVTLFERMPVAAKANVRVTGTPEVVAVEVAGGPCVRALVLCLQKLAESPRAADSRDIELRLSRHGPEVRIGLEADGPPIPLPGAAEALLGVNTGARLLSLDGLLTLALATPQ
jgi:hypothetical protein